MRIKCVYYRKRKDTKEGCGYVWNCKSTHVFVSCPSCMRKTKVVPIPIDENRKNFLEAYKRDKRVYDAGVAKFGKEETDQLIADWITKKETGGEENGTEQERISEGIEETEIVGE